MNVTEKVIQALPEVDFSNPRNGFRHPTHGLNRCPTEDDWDACVWSQVLTDAGINKPTLAELALVPDPPEVARDNALASIYAPVEYNGKLYPADAQSMAKYEMAKQSRGRGKAKKGVAIAVDGSVLKLSSASAIDAFHGAIEDAVIARLSAVHDAL